MRVMTSKSKNSESFYITKSYKNNSGKSTSVIVRKLGTLKELQEQLGTDRDGVVAWVKEQARIETEKYKSEQQQKEVLTLDGAVFSPLAANTDREEAASIAAVIAVIPTAFLNLPILRSFLT